MEVHHVDRFLQPPPLEAPNAEERKSKEITNPPDISKSLNFVNSEHDALESCTSVHNIFKPTAPSSIIYDNASEIKDCMIQMCNYKYYDPVYADLYLQEENPYENRANPYLGEYEMFNVNLYLIESAPKIYLSESSDYQAPVNCNFWSKMWNNVKTSFAPERFAFDAEDKLQPETDKEQENVPQPLPGTADQLVQKISQHNIFDPKTEFSTVQQEEIEGALLRIFNYKYYEPKYREVYYHEDNPYDMRGDPYISEFEMFNINFYLYDPSTICITWKAKKSLWTRIKEKCKCCARN